MRAAYGAGPYAHELQNDASWGHAEADTAGRVAGGAVLVAEEHGELLGAVSVLRPESAYAKLGFDDEAELRMLAVSPAAQGRGVGEALVRAGLEEALGWGCDALRLDTGVLNPAQKLYERIGFEHTVELDRVLLEKGYAESFTYRYQLQVREDVRARLIRPEELEQVSELVLAAYRDDYEGLGVDYLSEIADVETRAANHRVWVAEDTKTAELLGTITAPRGAELITAVSVPGEMDLRLLGVGQGARGRGIGGMLMAHCIKLAEIRGASQLVLETSPVMKNAWRLYDKLGFTRLTERDRDIVLDDGAALTLLTYGYPVARETAVA